MINHFKYLLIIIFSSFSFATTLYVATTGSDDTGDGTEINPFATIQKGIDSASDGDTVLVSAGTYVENINYNGKNIAVFGENRETTIIDGNQNGSVVTFESGEDSTTLLMSFTITNSGGFGENDWGGGVFVKGGSRATLDNLIIDDNMGGGLFGSAGGGGLCVIGNFSKANISNSIISNTTSESESGGLFTCNDGRITASNCLIVNNFYYGVSNGCNSGAPGAIELINCTVTNNNEGLYCMGEVSVSSSVIYDNLNWAGLNYNIIGGTLTMTNTLIQGGYEGTGNIDVYPRFCSPENGDYFLAENSPAVGNGENGSNMGALGVGCGPIGPVWYISNTGSDDIGDGSEEGPFATIQKGIDEALDGDTVLVSAGIYYENLMIWKNILVIGESRDATIIDGQNSGRCVDMGNGATISTLSAINGETPNGAPAIKCMGGNIENIIVANNKSNNGPGYIPNGTVIAENSTVLKNVIFYNNESWISGVETSGNVQILNCLFYDNFYLIDDSNDYSSIILHKNGVLNIDETTFYNNQSSVVFYNEGGAEFGVINSIVYGNLSYESVGGPVITYSNYEGGYIGDGNIDEDPLFCSPENGDYTLAENSPCIGAGENGSNIGALGEGCDALNFSLTINEIMNNPSAVSDSDGEWFEIFNNGDVSYDLNGWTIKDGGSDSHVVSSALIINPGEHKVLSNNSNQNTNGGLVVDYQYDGITLANSDDELVLIDPNGTVFDSVAYDGGPEFPDLTGTSMGVIDAESDNNVGSNWQASTTAYGDGDLGTPGLPNFSSDIDVELTTIDFDTVLVGESFEQVLSIYNNGNTTLLLDSVYTSSDLFTLPFTESSIDDLLELTITFTPSAYGIVEDTLVIKTNDPDESHVEIPLIAFGYVPSPNIVLESTSIDFGTVMDGLTETIELHVVNDGDVSLSLFSVYLEGSTNFTIQNFSASVAEEDTGSIDIQFSPDDETSFSGTLYIVSNDPDTDTLIVSLSGIGGEQAPVISSSENILNFGQVADGQISTQIVTIYNLGVVDLEIEEISFYGGNESLFSTDFTEASLSQNDSVHIEISYLGQSTIQYPLESFLVFSNDETSSPLSIILVTGFSDDILYSEIVYDDGNINDSFPVGSGNYIAQKFSPDSYPSILQTSSFYIYEEDQGDFVNIYVWDDDGDDGKPGTVLLGPLEFEMNPGWNICENLLHLIIEGSVYIGYQQGNVNLNLGIDEENESYVSNSMLNLGTISGLGWEQLNNYVPDGVWMIRAEFIADASPQIITIPENLEASFNNDGIHLTWDEITDEGFSHFILDKSYNEQFNPGDFTSIIISETNYHDTDYSQDSVTIYYRLSSEYTSGIVSDYSDIVSIVVNLGIDSSLNPEFFCLHQNHPNPFNPTTKISYDLPEASVVSLSIYDLMGRKIRTLINSEQNAGFKNIQWNATDNLGKSVPAGMYIYTIQAGEFRQTRKMVLLK